jgi:hypothetical protein
MSHPTNVRTMQCRRCGAIWSGEPGERCWWCEAESNALADELELLLTPPACTDPDSPEGEALYKEWCERLVNGMHAGLITADTARAAWRQAFRAVER